jgi:uncharacterized protein (TIGR02679 family)
VAQSELLATTDWAPRWVADVRASNLFSRDRGWDVLVPQAIAVLEGIMRLGDSGCAPASRTELAARHANNAHALDDGQPLAALVLRALAMKSGLDGLPREPVGRRELWEANSVLSDGVSTTCLTVGLLDGSGSPLARRLAIAAAHGEPVHLTGRDLNSFQPSEITTVLVCENPRVLEAIADEFRGRSSVVCAAGWPNSVVLRVLSLLGAAGVEMLYHGDFDWPGIHIANKMMVDVAGVRPWRMTAADYESALPRSGGLPLEGPFVEPTWDGELGAVMRRANVAVHEEAVLDRLLAAVSRFTAGGDTRARVARTDA